MGAIVESRAITRLARLFGKSLRRRQKRHGLSEATLTMGYMLQSFFVAHHTIEAFRHVQQAKESAEKATQAATKAALELTKEWIPSLMKGTGKKTIEKMAGNAGRFAGRAAPFIGPVIDTVRGIYDYYQETKIQEEYLQAMQRQARALADHVDQTTANLQTELIDACRVVVMPMFLPIEKALADQANGLAREHQSFVADRQFLDVLKLRLENAVNTH